LGVLAARTGVQLLDRGLSRRLGPITQRVPPLSVQIVVRTIFIFLVSQCLAPLLLFFVLSILPIAVAFDLLLGFLVFLLELFGLLVLIVLDFLRSLLDNDLLGGFIERTKLILDYEGEVARGFIVVFDNAGLQSIKLFFSETDCRLLLQLILGICRLRIQVSHCQEHVASLCLGTTVGN